MIKQLYTEKLKSSGLTLADAKKLGFSVVQNPSKDLDEHYYSVPAIVIPYASPKGKKLEFYRLRYLQNTNKGFLANTNAKSRRYDQPAAEIPQLYIPTNLRGWEKIFSDINVPIIFTEGELKAACACKYGLPTLALGGVWNFKAKKKGVKHLPIFDSMKLKGRTVYIIFDSDVVEKPQVLYAQYKFAEELCALGATPLICNIPKIEGQKHGIDDYIVDYGIDAFKQLITDKENHKEFGFVKQLMQLNTEIAICEKPVSIIHYPTNQLLKQNDASMLYANNRMIEQKMKQNSSGEETVTYNEVGTFNKWLQWPLRGGVYAPVYEPGSDVFVAQDNKRYYNTWKGWGTKPEKGDVRLWHWLLDNIFKNAEKEHRKWFEQWCAYPLQHPGVKMYSCPILFGQTKGTGKSLLGLTLMSIYGENGAEITDTQLNDERNVFAAEKQFVLANEVTGSDKRTMVGRLRNLITQHTVVINKKYQPDYMVRDTINYFFTSNYIDAVYMEDDERRFFVHEVLGPRLMDVSAEKVSRYDKWLRSGQAAASVFHYLLNVDLTGFDPTAPAPDTLSKGLMAAASRTELEEWCFKLAEDPDTCLRSGDAILPYTVFRSKDLIELYSAESGGKRPYAKTMTNALSKAGFSKAAGGQSCQTMHGKINLWAIRNADHQLASPTKIGIIYDQERELLKKDKKFTKEGRDGRSKGSGNRASKKRSK